MPVETIDKYSYRIEIECTERDAKYHEIDTALARVIDPASGNVLYTTAPRTSRSSHQLKKKYRAPANVGDLARDDAERWMLENLPRARAAYEVQAELARAAARESARERFEALGRDPLTYLREQDQLVTVSEMAHILNVSGAQSLNRRLIDWGLQEKVSDGYWPTHHEHARIVGAFAQLKWTTAGMKAAWDAGIKDGTFEGGDAEFTEAIRARTDWLSFFDATSPELKDAT